MIFYFLSLTSTQWTSLLSKDFWITNFISTFCSRLANGTDYELWYQLYNKLDLKELLTLSIKYQHYDLTSKLVTNFKAQVDLNQLLIDTANIDN